MAITTLAKVKAILQITVSDKDGLITELIPMVESDYLSIRKKAFDTDDEDNTVYPAGSELTAIRMIEYQMSNKTAGVKSESLGDYSASYEDASGKYPKSIIGGIRKYVKFV
jgi:hypothetical protein